MGDAAILNYSYWEDSRAEILSITFQLPVKTTSSVARIKIQDVVSGTKFSVDFSFISLVSKNLATLQEKKSGDWVQHCTWRFDENKLTILVNSAGFREEQPIHSTSTSISTKIENNLCRVFFVPKPIVNGVQSMLKIYAPQGYLEERRKLLRQNRLSSSPPAVRPPHEEVPPTGSDAVIERSSSACYSSSDSPSPLPPSYTLLRHLGREEADRRWWTDSTSFSFLRGEDYELLCTSQRTSTNSLYDTSQWGKQSCAVDDHNHSDVVLSLVLPISGVVKKSGYVLESIFYWVAARHDQAEAISTKTKTPDFLLLAEPPTRHEIEDHLDFVDEGILNDGEEASSFPCYNVQAVVTASDSITGSLELNIHFDSTISWPSMRFSRSTQEGSAGRCLPVVVAACKHLRCGDVLVDFVAQRSILYPSEDEVYEEINEIRASGALPNLTTETLDQYVRHIELRYSLIFNLSDEEIEDFQMILWSALRRCVFDETKPPWASS